MRTVLAVIALAVLQGQAAADPLEDLFASSGGRACYSRVYDAAHLAKNPRQITQAVTMSLTALDGGGAVMRVHIDTNRDDRYILAECSHSATPNDDTSGQPMVESYKAGAGLLCHAFASVDGLSAEEGGDFPVDDRDGQSMTLHLPDTLAGWLSLRKREAAAFIDYPPDDRVFLVRRGDPGTCAQLDAGLLWIEDVTPAAPGGAVDHGSR